MTHDYHVMTNVNGIYFLNTGGRYNTCCEIIIDKRNDANLRTHVIKKSSNPVWDDEHTL